MYADFGFLGCWLLGFARKGNEAMKSKKYTDKEYSHTRERKQLSKITRSALPQALVLFSDLAYAFAHNCICIMHTHQTETCTYSSAQESKQPAEICMCVCIHTLY